MTGKYKLILTRAAAVIMLFALLFAMMSVSLYRRVSALKTGNDELPYEYSDDEMYIGELPPDDGYDIYAMLRDADKKYEINDGFIDFIANDKNINFDGYFIDNCISELRISGYSDEMWESLTGYTFSVLYDIYMDTASDGDIVTVLGDIYDTRKTTVAIYSEAAEAGDADITLSLSEKPHTRFYISGGVKIAAVIGGGALEVSAASSMSDVVILIADTTDVIEPAAEAGAALIVTRDGERAVEILTKDRREIYAVSGLSDDVYLTLSVTVGVDPILRYFPTEDAEAEIERINSESKTANIDDKNRVKPKKTK